MSQTNLSLTLVITYLVIIKIVAYLAHKKSKQNLIDFFIANRNVSTLALVGTILATMINTLAVTGVPALVYKGGVLYTQMFFIGIIAPTLIYLFGSKIWKYGQKHKIITQGELFAHYYNSKSILILTALIGILAIFPFMTIQLSAIGKVFSAATENIISYEVAVIISSISIGAYLYFGGSRAIIWTDVIQAIFFLVIIILSAILFTHWSGGYSNGISQLKEVIPNKLSFNSKNTPIFIDNILSWPFAFFLWPQLFQRMFMAKSEDAIKKTVKWNFILFNLVVLCTMTMGIMATGTLYGQIQDADKLVAMMYQKFFPLGGSLILIAVFATGMSTIDSILLTSSSILNRDIFSNFFPKITNSKNEFKIAQLSALVFLVITTLFALSPSGRGAMAPLVTLGASFATLFLWPLLGMFYFKNISKNIILLTTIVGFTSICFSKFANLSLPYGIGGGTIGFLSCFFIFSSAVILNKCFKYLLNNTICDEICNK